MAEPKRASRSTKARGEKGSPEPKAQDRAPVCTVAFCPFCMAVTAAQGVAPDALEHLLAAAREFFLAARVVIDARGDHLSGGADDEPPARTLHRIDVS